MAVFLRYQGLIIYRWPVRRGRCPHRPATIDAMGTVFVRRGGRLCPPCHSEPVTDVDTLRKHAGGMFLASDLGSYAAVASILLSTAFLDKTDCHASVSTGSQ